MTGRGAQGGEQEGLRAQERHHRERGEESKKERDGGGDKGVMGESMQCGDNKERATSC
jgi:hypothetical protein